MANKSICETFTDSKGKRWSNQSVVALMRECSQGMETPQEVIRRLARAKVTEAKAEGWNEIPFDVELLAELQGITVKCADVDIKAEARLMPLPDRRLEIEYSGDAPETRRRFSICHEIAHTFFPDCFEQIQHRRNSQHFDPVHAELEQLCHIGAGELLMPYDEFTERTMGRDPSVQVSGELARQFNASQEAALRRMVDLSGKAYALLWISSRLKPLEVKGAGLEFDLGFAQPKPKLRIDYQFSSAQWRIFVPRHKSIPDNSILYKVLQEEPFSEATEDWSGLSLGQVHVEALSSLHSGLEAKGVMALVKQI